MFFDTQEMRTKITNELHITELPEDVQNEMLESFGVALHQRVINTVFEMLPQEVHPRMHELVQANDQQALGALIEEHIPNVESLMQEVLVQGLAEYKQLLNNTA